MVRGNRVRTGLDILISVLGWVTGTIGLGALLRMGLDFLSTGTIPGIDTGMFAVILLQVGVCIVCGHYIVHKGIKALYIMAICIPLILMLLSQFVVKSPIIPF